jgi:hypothetical protein
MQVTGSYTNRGNKESVREGFFEGLPEAKVIVSLPGSEMICVKKMIEKKIIGETTVNFWVERDKIKANIIERMGRELDLFGKVHNGDIRTWLPRVPFDLLNLDLEESFTERAARWLETLSENALIEDGAHLLLWFTQTSRNGHSKSFIERFDALVASDEILQKQVEEIRATSQNHHSPEWVRAVLIASCSLRKYDLRVKSIRQYQDSVPMIAMKIQATRRTSPPILPKIP